MFTMSCNMYNVHARMMTCVKVSTVHLVQCGLADRVVNDAKSLLVSLQLTED